MEVLTTKRHKCEHIILGDPQKDTDKKSTLKEIQLFDLFRRTHIFRSISILSPALNSKFRRNILMDIFVNTYWIKPHTEMGPFLYEGY